MVFPVVSFLSKNDAEKAIEGIIDKDVKEKKIRVDCALSQEKFRSVKALKKAPVKGEVEEVEVKQEAGSDVEMTNEGGDESVDEDDKVDVGMEDDDEQPVKPTLPAVEEGSTLCIRNLPFVATEEELPDL